MNLKSLSSAALGVVVCLGVQAPAQAGAITFTPAPDGLLLNSLISPFPLIASISGAGTHGAMICDTSSGSDCVEDEGGRIGKPDSDLVTPNPTEHSSNTAHLGNVVVISKYGDTQSGDPADGIAGIVDDATPYEAGLGRNGLNSLTFTFVESLQLVSLLFIDRDVGEHLQIFVDDVKIFDDPEDGGLGNAAVELVDIDTSGLELRVEYGGSGGVAQINVVAPLPPALWLFGASLVGLVGLAKRRKAP